MFKKIKQPIPYERKKSIAGFLFVLPWLLGFVFIVARPLINSIGYAFSDTTITTEGMELSLLGEIRTGHVLYMTREMWAKIK